MASLSASRGAWPSFGLGAASLTALAALTALTACGGSATSGPTGSGQGGAGGAGNGAGGMGGAAPACDDGIKNGAEPGVDCGGPDCAPCATNALDCKQTCAKPAENGCFNTASCEAECAKSSPGWNDPISAAFATCVANDPLCFTTLESCMLKALYPDPVAQDVKISATGFDAHEGHTVYASFEKPGGELVAAAPQKVKAGAFVFTWSVVMPVDNPHLILYYVDIDENGSCLAAADLPGSEMAERPPGFELPSWSVEITGPKTPAAFVCDYL